jgi:ADP-ribose pyrophosphatase YjhB (NUDIX family)
MMSPGPELTVAAVVERDGRFLLVEETIAGRLVFTQPGGHVEDGESPHDAVIREVLEETAWDFAPQSLLASYQSIRPATGRTIRRIAFIGSVTHHHPGRALDRGIVAVHWMTRGEIVARLDRLRSPLVLRCVDDYLQQRAQPLDCRVQLGAEPSAAQGTTSR